METEARDFGAGLLACLKQREVIRNLDLFSVDFQLGIFVFDLCFVHRLPRL